MIVEMIENYRLKREIELAKREKKRTQAFCPHELVELKEGREMYYSGYDVDFRDVYQSYCPVCDKTMYYETKTDLTNALLKQEARELNGALHK